MPPASDDVVVHRTELALYLYPTVSRDAAAYARKLYAALHELDAEGLDWIGLDLPPDAGDWQALRDRISRAAAD